LSAVRCAIRLLWHALWVGGAGQVACLGPVAVRGPVSASQACLVGESGLGRVVGELLHGAVFGSEHAVAAGMC
jgi:hypothetical protein